MNVPSAPLKSIVRMRVAVAVHVGELPSTIVLRGHEKMSVGAAPTDVTTVVAPLENPLAAYESPSTTPASEGLYETEQLFAVAAIVHEPMENVPEPVVLKTNVSVGEPTAVQFVVVPNVTVLGAQLSGGRFAAFAFAIAGPPAKPTMTAAATVPIVANKNRRRRRALTDSSAAASASPAAGTAARVSRALRS